MSGTVPDPSVLTDEAWLERAERRARRCVRNPAAYPCLPAKFVAALVAEMDRLRAQREAAKGVLDAACAYSDSTAEPTDTPHEDALLDAVTAYRDARPRLPSQPDREAENADLRTRLDVLQASALDLHSQLDEARAAIRVLTGAPRAGDGPALPPTGETP